MMIIDVTTIRTSNKLRLWIPIVGNCKSGAWSIARRRRSSTVSLGHGSAEAVLFRVVFSFPSLSFLYHYSSAEQLIKERDWGHQSTPSGQMDLAGDSFP